MSIAAQLQRTVRNAGAQAMAAAVADRVRELESTVPVKTGRLKRSRTNTGLGAGATGFAVTISYTAPYAKFVEEGTRPHTIRPRRGKVLRFVSGGRTVFARVVHHPGTRPSRWFRRALNAATWRQALLRGLR